MFLEANQPKKGRTDSKSEKNMKLLTQSGNLSHQATSHSSLNRDLVSDNDDLMTTLMLMMMMMMMMTMMVMMIMMMIMLKKNSFQFLE